MARNERSLKRPLIALLIAGLLIVVGGAGSVASQMSMIGRAVNEAIHNGETIPNDAQMELEAIPYLVTALGTNVSQCTVTDPSGDDLDVALLAPDDTIEEGERIAVARFNAAEAGTHTIDCTMSGPSPEGLELAEVPDRGGEDLIRGPLIIGLVSVGLAVVIGAFGLVGLFRALAARRRWN